MLAACRKPASAHRPAAGLVAGLAAGLLLLSGARVILTAAETAPAPASRFESLRITPALPLINVFLTAGPFTETQLKNWSPDGKPARFHAEPAGLDNPAHHTWQLHNQGRYPAKLGVGFTPTKERQWMLVSFDLSTDTPGGRYLKMCTDYGRRLRGWQGEKQIYFQDSTTYQSSGTNITLGANPETFTMAVELAASPSMVDLGVFDASGAKSASQHRLRVSLPGDYTAERLFAEGLIFQAPFPMLDAQGRCEIRAYGCSPKLPITQKFAVVIKQGETVLSRVEYADSATLEQRGQAFTIKPAADPEHGVIQLTTGIEMEGLQLPTRSLPVYALAGLRAEMAVIDAQLQALPASAAANARYRRETVATLMNAAALQPGGLASHDADDLIATIDQVRSLLSVEAKGGFPFAGRHGGSVQAYVAPQDNSVQPYLVYIPSSYDPAKSYPLVCYLHGYVPTYDRHNWIDLAQMPDFVAAMERNDCILCVPFGRSNTDFLQVGEVDTLAVIDRMQAHYNIDPTRVYLYGYSMGGSGVYTLASHYPQRFAAAVVLAGRTDYYLWHQPSKKSTPRFKQVMISRDNPIEQVGNFANLPLQIHHGQQDGAVLPIHSRSFRDALAARQFTCELIEYPGGSHWIGIDVMGKDEPLQFLLRHRRTARMDEAVSLKTWSSRFGARNNFAVLLTDDPTQPAELEAHWNNGRLTIEKLNNVAALEVRNIAPMRRDEFELVTPPGVEWKAEWTDQPAFMSRLVLTPRNSPLTQAKLDDPARLLKTPDTSGTVQDAFNGPFILTYGTVADAELNRQRADEWAREWAEFAKGQPRVVADSAITDELAAEHNLILIGQPASHSYWAKLQPKLPIEVKDNTVTLDDHVIALGANRGLLYIHPNPEHPRRYVVLNAGIRYGSGLPINHKLDLLPDFLIYTHKTMVGGDDTNQPLVGGFFSRDWRLNPAFIDVFDE